jgi:hypothetical protein
LRGSSAPRAAGPSLRPGNSGGGVQSPPKVPSSTNGAPRAGTRVYSEKQARDSGGADRSPGDQSRPDEAEARRRKREALRANGRRETMVGRGGGGHASASPFAFGEAPPPPESPPEVDGVGGSRSAYAHRKSQFSRGAFLPEPLRRPSPHSQTVAAVARPHNPGRPAPPPVLEAYGLPPEANVPASAAEGASSDDDAAAAVAARVGTSAVVYWAPPQRPAQLGLRQGQRLGQRLGGGATPPAAKLRVTVKSAVGLRNVQLVGAQDPVVRVWTTFTRRGDECETKPHLNGHKEGVWNETFVFPALKHQQRMVLVFEVRNAVEPLPPLPSPHRCVGMFTCLAWGRVWACIRQFSFLSVLACVCVRTYRHECVCARADLCACPPS